MLLSISLLCLIAWLLGLFGVYTIGDVMHVFLAIGLLLMFKARDDARRRREGRVS